MALITVSEVKTTFGKLRVEELASEAASINGKPVYDESLLEAAITRAESLVVASLIRFYTVVQLAADEGVKTLALNLTLYFLELRRGEISETTLQLYSDALKLLQALQSGTLLLADVSALLPVVYHPNENSSLLITQSGLFDGIHNDAEDSET